MNRTNWFPTPIWDANYNFDLDAIKSFCIDYSKKNQSVFKSNQGGWQSDILNREEKNVVTDALKVLEKDCNDYIKNDYVLNKPITITGSWININNQGDSNKIHVHPHSIISGCLYITQPDENSKIVFETPKIFQESYEIRYIDSYTDLTYTYANYESVPNRAIFFPSWLKHYVTTNRSDKPRISIAFNFE